MIEKKVLRECPHCHKSISLRNTSIYLLRGTKHIIRCNHCHNEVRPSKEPMPFNTSVVGGFLSVVIPLQICLYYFRIDFLGSLLIASIFWIFWCIIVSLCTFTRIEFTKF